VTIPLKPLAAAALIASALPAAADCYADYKASQGKQLQLHYGVMQISDDACAGGGRPEKEVRQRLKDAGWKLLNVMSVFGPEGLDERRASAGEYFLRY
jgi:hypothetical protein